MASVFCHPLPGFGLVAQLSMCRFILGLGVGGQYPLIASITAESVPVEMGPFAVAGVFSVQGFGVLFSSLIPVILLVTDTPLEYVWRVSLLVGALPTVIVLYKWWYVRPESVNAAMQASVPDRNDDAFADYSFVQILVKHAVAFTGTCSTWFLAGGVYYGMASFRSQLSAEYDIKTDLLKQNAFSMLFAAATIPGFLMTILFIKKIGVRRLQTFGFFCMALSLVMAAHFQGRWHKGIITVTLALTFFFASFGPNATTFILPALYYPVSERTTCHGVSGAFGKLGSIVGAAAFAPLNEAFGINGVFYAFAVACFLGMICTILCCPDPSTDVMSSKKQLLANAASTTFSLAPKAAYAARVSGNEPSLKADNVLDMEANQETKRVY
eukprot:GEMP01031757.1.p1 GENE.GEMP01031757.1~~GEMP01031757.1.p1  ORF type:complete len:383 (+),score=63.90 GEMP01031757.1:552-1700(+)